MPASNLSNGLPALPNRVVFQDFAPDAEPTLPNILLDCDNVYPTAKGFRSYPSLQLYSSNRLPSTCFGIYGGESNGAVLLVAGTTDQLYELDPTTRSWNSIGATLTPINVPSRWRFDMYGQLLVAVNGVDPPLVRSGLGVWSALGGSPPVASIVQATDYSLFLIEPNSSTWWSSLSATLWTPSIATQTVTGSIDSTPGNIVAAHDLRGALAIYKRKSLFYSSFIGPPFYWDFNKVSDQIGAPCQEAVANIGDVHYFPGPDDFYAFDGQSLQRIPNNLKEWYFSVVDQTTDYLTCARWDQQRSLIFWHFRSISGPTQRLDTWIAYNIRTGRWSKGRELIDITVFSPTQTGNLNYFTYKLNHTTYADVSGLYGDLRSLAIDATGVIKTSDNALYFYTGAPGRSYVQTSAFGDRHNKFEITRLRPHFTLAPNAGASVAVFSQSKPGETAVLKLTKGISSDGWFNFRNTACLQVFKMTLESEMEIVGADVLSAYAGER